MHPFETSRFGTGSVLISMPAKASAMSETRKIAAILAADVVGYSRLAGADEDRTLARLRALRSDVVEEADGDLMGDGVNIAARLESIAEPGGVCLSEDAYRQVRDRVKETFVDLGEKALKNIARPVRVYELQTSSGRSALCRLPPHPKNSARRVFQS